MAADNKIKKKVTQNWVNFFQDLYPFAQNKLYKITGLFISGIELLNIPRVEEYRPHFVLYPLYGNTFGNDLSTCLKYPAIFYEFFDDRGNQFSIPYNDAPRNV